MAVWPGVVERFDGPAVARDHLAVGERDVGPEIHVAAGIEPARLADVQRPRRPVRAFGEDRGAGRGLDPGHRRRMIAMGVGDEDVGHGLAAHRVEQRRDMGVVVRAGIEDRDFAAADDVAHRALEGERARDCWRRPRARRGATSSAVSGARSKLLSNGMSSVMGILRERPDRRSIHGP